MSLLQYVARIMVQYSILWWGCFFLCSFALVDGNNFTMTRPIKRTGTAGLDQTTSVYVYQASSVELLVTQTFYGADYFCSSKPCPDHVVAVSIWEDGSGGGDYTIVKQCGGKAQFGGLTADRTVSGVTNTSAVYSCQGALQFPSGQPYTGFVQVSILFTALASQQEGGQQSPSPQETQQQNLGGGETLPPGGTLPGGTPPPQLPPGQTHPPLRKRQTQMQGQQITKYYDFEATLSVSGDLRSNVLDTVFPTWFLNHTADEIDTSSVSSALFNLASPLVLFSSPLINDSTSTTVVAGLRVAPLPNLRIGTYDVQPYYVYRFFSTPGERYSVGGGQNTTNIGFTTVLVPGMPITSYLPSSSVLEFITKLEQPQIGRDTSPTGTTGNNFATTFACLFDNLEAIRTNATTTSRYYMCFVPIPKNANYLEMMVENSDWEVSQSNSGTVNEIRLFGLEHEGSTEKAPLMASCSGDVQNDFSGEQLGALNQCGRYKICYNQFLPVNETSWNVIGVNVTSAEFRSSCNFSLSVIFNFSKREVEAASSATCNAQGKWFCKPTRRCLPLEQVCDKVMDCSDQSDEEQCTSWQDFGMNVVLFDKNGSSQGIVTNESVDGVEVLQYLLDTGVVKQVTPEMLSVGTSDGSPLVLGVDVVSCKRYMMVHNYSAFIFRWRKLQGISTVKECYVYDNTTFVQESFFTIGNERILSIDYFSSLTNGNVSADSASEFLQLFAYVPGSSVPFVCSDEGTCRGRGTAIQTAEHGCQCVCQRGMSGQLCQRTYYLSDLFGLVIWFPSDTNPSQVDRQEISKQLRIPMVSGLETDFVRHPENGRVGLKFEANLNQDWGIVKSQVTALDISQLFLPPSHPTVLDLKPMLALSRPEAISWCVATKLQTSQIECINTEQVSRRRSTATSTQQSSMYYDVIQVKAYGALTASISFIGKQSNNLTILTCDGDSNVTSSSSSSSIHSAGVIFQDPTISTFTCRVLLCRISGISEFLHSFNFSVTSWDGSVHSSCLTKALFIQGEFMTLEGGYHSKIIPNLGPSVLTDPRPKIELILPLVILIVSACAALGLTMYLIAVNMQLLKYVRQMMEKGLRIWPQNGVGEIVARVSLLETLVFTGPEAGKQEASSPKEEKKEAEEGLKGIDADQLRPPTIMRYQTSCIITVIFFVFLCLAMGYLLVLYATKNNREVNLHITLEMYRDASCYATLWNQVPNFGLQFPATDVCTILVGVGFSLNGPRRYIKGHCLENTVVAIAVGDSIEECLATTNYYAYQSKDQFSTNHDAAQCLHLDAFFYASTVYGTLRCMPQADAEARMATLGAIIQDTSSDIPTTPRILSGRSILHPQYPANISLLLALSSASDSLASLHSLDTNLISTWGYRDLNQQKIRVSSSFSPGNTIVVSTAATTRYFASALWEFGFDPFRLVLQSHKDWLEVRESENSQQSGSVEDLKELPSYEIASNVMSTLPSVSFSQSTALAPLLPKNENIPSRVNLFPSSSSSSDDSSWYTPLAIGTLFNKWTRSDKVLALAESKGNAFYNVRGTSFDMGKSFGPDNNENDAGFTIQLWLATTSSNGILLAVADVYEEDGSSYLLTQLIFGIERQTPQLFQKWFDKDWHVYTALLIDDGKNLVFLTATPLSELQPGENPISTLVWDLSLIKMLRVFNGMWHQISLVFTNANSRTDVQLFIDGETHIGEEGWTQCLRRRPLPIVAPRETVHVGSTQVLDVVEGGALYVGMVAGSIYGVEFTSRPKMMGNIVFYGTGELYEHAVIDKAALQILGFICLVLGCMFAICSVYLAIADRNREISEGALRTQRQLAKVLYHLIFVLEKAKREEGERSMEEGERGDQETVLKEVNNDETGEEKEDQTFNEDAKGEEEKEKENHDIQEGKKEELLSYFLPFHAAMEWIDLGQNFILFVELLEESIESAGDVKELAHMVRRMLWLAKMKKDSRGNHDDDDDITVTAWNKQVDNNEKKIEAYLKKTYQQKQKEKGRKQIGNTSNDFPDKNNQKEEQLYDDDDDDIFSSLRQAYRDPRYCRLREKRVPLCEGAAMLLQRFHYQPIGEKTRYSHNNDRHVYDLNVVIVHKGKEGETASESSDHKEEQGEKGEERTKDVRQQNVDQPEDNQAFGIATALHVDLQNDIKSSGGQKSLQGQDSENQFKAEWTRVDQQIENVKARGNVVATGTAEKVPLHSVSTAMTDPSLGDMGVHITHVFQSISIWMLAIQFPKMYKLSFGNLFNFISLDLTLAFDLPATVTPVLQFSLVTVIVMLMILLLLIDDRKFMGYAARYVQKRDLLEGHNHYHHSTASFLSTSSTARTMQQPPPTGRNNHELSFLKQPKEKGEARGGGGNTDKANVMALTQEREEQFPLRSSSIGLSDKEPPVQLIFAPSRGIIDQTIANFEAKDHNNENKTLQQEEVTVIVDEDSNDQHDVHEKKECHVVIATKSVAKELFQNNNNNFGGRKMAAWYKSALVPEKQLKKARVADTDVYLFWKIKRGTKNNKENFFFQPIEKIGVRCPFHDRILTQVVQTEVFPEKVELQKKCAVVDGRGLRSPFGGQLYACKAIEETKPDIPNDSSTSSSEIVLSECQFCLSNRYFRPNFKQRMVAILVGKWRSVESLGLVWFSGRFSLLLCTLLYMPTVRTALMILNCHPMFQCLFGICWKGAADSEASSSRISSSFAVAAYFSIFVVVFYGLGAPIIWLVFLAKRYVVLNKVFRDPCYDGYYLHPILGEKSEKTAKTKKEQHDDEGKKIHNNKGSSRGVEQEGNPLEMRSLQKASSSKNNNGAPQGSPSDVLVVSLEESDDIGEGLFRFESSKDLASSSSFVNMNGESPILNCHYQHEKNMFGITDFWHPIRATEWFRFLATDATALSWLYQRLRYKWIFLPPFVLLLKILLVLPSVLGTPQSFGLFLGLAIAEICYALLNLIVRPYLSFWTNLLIRCGSVHQVLLIGVLCFHSRKIFEDGKETGLETALMSVTGIYILVVVFIVVFVRFWRPLQRSLMQSKKKEMLCQLGVPLSLSATLYMQPDASAVDGQQ